MRLGTVLNRFLDGFGCKMVPKCSQNRPETDWKAFGRRLRHRKNAKDDFRLRLDRFLRSNWIKIDPKNVKMKLQID